jgi:hypothetical protein
MLERPARRTAAAIPRGHPCPPLVGLRHGAKSIDARAQAFAMIANRGATGWGFKRAPLVFFVKKRHMLPSQLREFPGQQCVIAMTIQEPRGAAQPGVREIEKMMRLSWALDEQARDLATVFAAGSVFTVASTSDVRLVRPTSIPHAHVG